MVLSLAATVNASAPTALREARCPPVPARPAVAPPVSAAMVITGRARVAMMMRLMGRSMSSSSAPLAGDQRRRDLVLALLGKRRPNSLPPVCLGPGPLRFPGDAVINRCTAWGICCVCVPPKMGWAHAPSAAVAGGAVGATLARTCWNFAERTAVVVAPWLARN